MSELHDAVREQVRAILPGIESGQREAGIRGAGRTYGITADNGARFVVDANGDLHDDVPSGWKWEELGHYDVRGMREAAKRDEAEERFLDRLDAKRDMRHRHKCVTFERDDIDALYATAAECADEGIGPAQEWFDYMVECLEILVDYQIPFPSRSPAPEGSE